MTKNLAPPNWQVMTNDAANSSALERTFTFLDFSAAFGFMTRVALLAESHGHHPNWSNVWNTVTITLTTHDAKNQVTEKDYALAQAINTLVD
jgi:4a-hydroxytetrahydrobiopterin dehydratase